MELITILNKYGKLSEEEGISILEKTLTTEEGNQEIKVNEIWNGEIRLTNSETVIEFTIKVNANGMASSGNTYSFQAYKGETWEEWESRLKENGEWNHVNESSEYLMELLLGKNNSEDLLSYYQSGGGMYCNIRLTLNSNDCLYGDEIVNSGEYTVEGSAS